LAVVVLVVRILALMEMLAVRLLSTLVVLELLLRLVVLAVFRAGLMVLLVLMAPLDLLPGIMVEGLALCRTVEARTVTVGSLQFLT
jgi:hypothetical protein